MVALAGQRACMRPSHKVYSLSSPLNSTALLAVLGLAVLTVPPPPPLSARARHYFCLSFLSRNAALLSLPDKRREAKRTFCPGTQWRSRRGRAGRRRRSARLFFPPTPTAAAVLSSGATCSSVGVSGVFLGECDVVKCLVSVGFSLAVPASLRCWEFDGRCR